MRRIRLIIPIILMAGVFSADSRSTTTSAFSRGRADVRGKITRISRLEDLYYRDVLGSISIEGIKEADTRHDLANVEIMDETRFFRMVDGERKPASFTDVKLTQRVEAEFTKPVPPRKQDRPDCYTEPCGLHGAVSSSSAPVRARAAEIVILEQ